MNCAPANSIKLARLALIPAGTVIQSLLVSSHKSNDRCEVYRSFDLANELLRNASVGLGFGAALLDETDLPEAANSAGSLVLSAVLQVCSAAKMVLKYTNEEEVGSDWYEPDNVAHSADFIVSTNNVVLPRLDNAIKIIPKTSSNSPIYQVQNLAYDETKVYHSEDFLMWGMMGLRVAAHATSLEIPQYLNSSSDLFNELMEQLSNVSLTKSESAVRELFLITQAVSTEIESRLSELSEFVFAMDAISRNIEDDLHPVIQESLEWIKEGAEAWIAEASAFQEAKAND